MTKSLRDIVFYGLSQAKENGYDMSDHTPAELAGDMLAYDYDTEMFFQGREDIDAMEAEMIPHIVAWRKEQK